VRELLFGLLAGRDVAGDAFDGCDLTGWVLDEAQPLLHPDDRAVLPRHLDVPCLAQAGPALVAHHLHVHGLYEVEDEARVGVELLDRVPGDLDAGRRHVVEARPVLEPVAEDEVLGVLGEDPEALLASAQSILRTRAVGDVRGDAGDGVGHTIGIEERELVGEECHRR
jgi:hypothetical protein